MKAMDRHKARVADLVNAPMTDEEYLGAASEDVKTYTPLAAGLISEIAAKQLKKKEDAEAKAKLESSDAFKAKKAAEDARKRAAMAQADAVTEVDPNGPKHRAAAQYDLEALAAEQKAMFYAQQAAMSGAAAGAASTGLAQYGQPRQDSSLFTTKNLLIAGGVVLGLGLVVLLVRK